MALNPYSLQQAFEVIFFGHETNPFLLGENPCRCLCSQKCHLWLKKKRDPIKTTGPTAGKAALEQMPVEAVGRCAEPGSGPSHQNRGL